MIMTSAEFELTAKQAVSKMVKYLFEIDASVEDMDIVWLAHIFGDKKCVIFSRRLPYYIEVTYDSRARLIYVDFYKKVVQQRLYVTDD